MSLLKHRGRRKVRTAKAAAAPLLAALAFASVLPPGLAAQDIEPPAAVTDLAAAQGAAGGEILLQWTAPGDNGPSGDISGGTFKVRYSTDPAALSILLAQVTRSTDMVQGSVQGLKLTGLEGGATYYISLWTADAAANGSGASNNPSAWAQLSGASVPSSPGNFAGTPLSTGSISWTWIDNAVDEDGYRLRGSTGGVVAAFGPGAAGLLETGLTINTSYYRYLEVYNSTGSALTSGATVYTLSASPSGTYVAARSSRTVQIAWSANGNSAGTRWGIQRSTDGFASSTTVKGFADDYTALNYLDPGLTPHVTYYYRVMGYNGDSVPSYGGTVSTYTLSTPTAPGSFSGAAVSSTSIWYTWTDNSDDEDGFRLRTAAGGLVVSMEPNKVSYVKTGLNVNSMYQYYLEVHNSAGVAVTASTSVYTLSAAPAGSRVVSRSSRSVEIGWNANGNPGSTRWGIERSSNNFSSSQLIVGIGDEFTALGYTDTGLLPYVTYYYRVFSYNGVGYASFYDSIVSTYTLSPPAAPGFPSATTLSASSMRWEWADNAADEDGYRLRNSAGGVAAVLGANATTYLETGLAPNTSHFYYVEAYNSAGPSTSPVAAGYTLSMEPSGSYVSARTSASVQVSWSANGNPAATKWGIERSIDNFASSVTVKGLADNYTSLNYLDSGLAGYVTYYYRIRSYSFSGVPSAFDAVVSTFTLSPPAAPGSFTGTAPGAGAVQWNWADAAVDEDGYRLKNSTSGEVIAGLGPGTTWYLETGLSVNTSYARYAEAYNQAGTGVSASTAVYTLSMKPAGLYVAARSSRSVEIAWSANGNPAGTRWGIQRSTNNFSTVQVLKVSSNAYTAQNYTDSGLTAHVTYYYRVLSYNGNGFASAFDSAVSTFTLSTPTAPGSFKGEAVGTGSIRWNWFDTADDEDGFRLRDSSGVAIVSLAPDTTWYLKTGLTPNTSCVYYMEAYNSAGWTATPSTTVFTRSMPPSGTYVAAKTSSTVLVSWGQNGNAPGTRWGIQRSRYSNFSPAQTLTASTHNYTATSYLDTGLTADVTYYYQVLGYNGVGYASDYDASVSTFTLSPPLNMSGFAGGAMDGYSINWSWGDNAFNEDGYRLKNSAGGMIASLPMDTTYYMETGLTVNTAYMRYVEGYNQAGTSPSALTAAFTLSLPPSGSYLLATTSYSAQIGWSLDGNPSGTRWGIERSTDLFASAQSLKIYEDNYTALDFTDTGLECATTYYYRVLSYNGIGMGSGYDSSAKAVTLPAVVGDTTPPAGVADLSARPGPASGELLLAWTSPGDDRDWGGLSTATLKIRYLDVMADLDVSYAQITISTALAPGAGREYLLSGLTPGVTYYAAVWLADENPNWSVRSNIASGPAMKPPAPAAPEGFAGVALDSGTVRWTWQDRASTEDGYRIRTPAGGLIAELSADATFYLERGLAMETVYARYAEAWNFTAAAAASTASVRTLAATPSGFRFTEVAHSSVTLAWDAAGNRADASYRVDYWGASGSTSAVVVSTLSALLTGLEEAATYFFTVGALNVDGAVSAPGVMLSTFTPALPNISTCVPVQADVAVSLEQDAGTARVFVPAGAFGEPVTLTLKTPLEYPPAGPGDPGAPSGAGLEILTDRGLQPARTVTITIGYRDGDVPGMRKDRLVIGRYDPAGGRWVLLPSFPDQASRTVTAYTSHFSLYRIFEVLPAAGVSAPWIFPNPFRPSKGHATVTFSNLPAYSTLKIYSIDGNKVRVLKCNASGLAYWDGRNSAGREVSSGLYLVHTGLGSEFGTMKVVVQR